MSRPSLCLGVSLAIAAIVSVRSPLSAQTTASAVEPASASLASISSSVPDSPIFLASLAKPAFLGSPIASLSSFAPAGAAAAALPTFSPELAAIFAFPCSNPVSTNSDLPGAPDADATPTVQPCLHTPNPYTRFLDTTIPIPLTPAQKGLLALHNLRDPGNLATIAYNSAFTIAIDSHTAFGPGIRGFALDAGYTFSQDATGEFFGTFLIPSLAHQDPHYHRMPSASIPRRILHAVAHTVIAQSDTGSPMPNFSTLLTYPIVNEISNLYVPGINPNGPSTVERILTGYATDPVDNLITEFLPDVARHIHVHVLFAQRIINQISTDNSSLP